MNAESRYWYAARRYRWGYRHPLTWEGWLVDIVLFASLIALSPYVRQRAHPFQSLGLLFGLLALYVTISHWKGEPNHWND
jgi:hypothetical protein